LAKVVNRLRKQLKGKVAKFGPGARLSFEQRISMAQLIRYALDKVYFDRGEQKQ